MQPPAGVRLPRRRAVLPGTVRPPASVGRSGGVRDWRFDGGKPRSRGPPPVVRSSCDGKQSRVLASSNGTSPSARSARALPGRLRVDETAPASEKRTRTVTVRAQRGPQAAVDEKKNTTDAFRPQIRRDYPPNLSILISGGKENNRDSPSSGERTGKSPSPNLAAHFCVAARMRVVAYGPARCRGARDGPSLP